MQDLHRFSEIQLDSLWEYCPGIDSSKGFKIEKANTVSLRNEKNLSLDWNGTGWFKKLFVVPDSLRGKPVLCWIGQFGASEIYLDGQLVKSYGVINSDFKQGNYVIPRGPFLVQLDHRVSHTWTVLYSNRKTYTQVVTENLNGFWLLMATESRLSIKQDVIANHSIISFSLIFSFAIFFFCVFLFYPNRKSSLLTSIFLLDFACIFLSIYISEGTVDIYNYIIYYKLWKSFVIALNFILIITINTLYYGKWIKRNWFILLGMSLTVLLIWLVPKLWSFAPVVLLLLWVESIRISIVGIKHQKPGFWILLIGILVGMFFFFFFIDNTFGYFDFFNVSLFQKSGRLLSDLLNPLMFALQLAWEFGSSNRRLQDKLGEVQVLSASNLAKELEKQQILASQNETLEREVFERTNSLNQSLEHLQATQKQLVQSEKMASLGELTAGIAHEIQNPLNFVNNFSELSNELIAEMNGELDKGYTKSAKLIAEDIRLNLEKINHHGKRADAIVKGMIQHSRGGSGEKEPTNINALAKEWLQLSYSGYCAKEKDFNAVVKTDFDPSIKEINVIPQEIGRVLLNIYNNAYYAMSVEAIAKKETGYTPMIVVRTKQYIDKVEITVSDNGGGIPQIVLEKIFQPFFTTKPTGQGTGLGLSLSYDIIKTHGGEIEVVSTAETGTSFIIHIPYS